MKLVDGISPKILEYQTEFLNHLSQFIAIPSVRSEKRENMPFGKSSGEALNFILSLGQTMGFSVENCDGYAGSIAFGDAKEYVGVAVHADVVPAGGGWQTDPFCLTERDGFLYGRGVSDDKGPALCALYAMRILKELGYQPQRQIRLIVGAGEETGMEDLNYYFQKHEYPSLGFSPDGDYPMVNRESGIFNILGEFSLADSILQSFDGGSVYNAVPDKAECVVIDENPDTEKLETLLASYQSEKGTIKYQCEENTVHFLATGTAYHASQAECGFNAVMNLLCFILAYYGEKIGAPLCELVQNIGMETNGKSLHIDRDDGISKALTLNVGWLHIQNGQGQVGLDIRYPVTASGDDIFADMKGNFQKISLTISEHLKPLYVPETCELIQKLKQVYEEVTRKDGTPIAMAGGTYARAMGGNAVAFGAAFGGGREGNIHMPNEFVQKEALWENIKICALAMAALGSNKGEELCR